MPKVLIITGDAGESYEALYAVHRFAEEAWETVVAAPSRRRLNLVIHDFEEGWDTYIERPGYGLAADLTFDEVRVADYDAVLVLGGRAPEYLRNNAKVIEIVREFDRTGKWVWGICHGVQILAAAGLTRGRRITCYEHVRWEAEQAGGTWIAEQTVTRRTDDHGADVAIASRIFTGRFSRSSRASPVPLDPEVAALLERQKDLPPRSSLDVAGHAGDDAAVWSAGRHTTGAAESGRHPDSGGPWARQYWPASDSGLPIVVYLHGGRFFSGDLESHDTLCRLLALEVGCRVLAVDYRLAPEHRFPAAVEDACVGMDWVSRQGVPFGVAGDSAGANLAASRRAESTAGRGCAARC